MHAEASLDTTFLSSSPSAYEGMHLHECETLKPRSRTQRDPPSLRKSPAPPFEMSCAVPSLTATSGTTNILLLLPEEGRSKQLLSQGREEEQQEGRPTQPPFQGPAMLLWCCHLHQVSFRKNKFADFKVFAAYSPCPQLLSLQQALAGCSVGLFPRKYRTAAEHALPRWPNATPERAAPRAAGAATGGAWEVFRDLFGLRFDGQNQQELGSSDHQQGPLSQSPDTGWHRAAELQEPPQSKHFPRPPLHCHRYFAWFRLGRWYKMVGLAINNFS